MKKRRYSRAVCLAAVILTMLFCAVFPARVRAEEGHIGHVIDTYGLFSDADFSELEAACEQFEQQTGIQTAILSVDMDTVGGSRDKDSIRFIEDYADHLPEDDFVGLIINMDTRYYYIDVRGGEALRIYTDSRQEQLGDDVVDELAQGNYLGAGEAFLDGARRQCEYARNNNSYGEIRKGKSGFELDTFVVAARRHYFRHCHGRPGQKAQRDPARPGSEPVYRAGHDRSV